MDTPELTLDIGAAVDTIGNDLGFNDVADTQEPVVDDTPEPAAAATPEPAKPGAGAATVTPVQQPAAKAPPASWSKDKHELWSKLPPDAQDYYEQRENQMKSGVEQFRADAEYARQLRDIVNPYRSSLQAQNVSEVQAVKYLLAAHHGLTSGTPQERAAAYEKIGRELGLTRPDPNAPQVDPVVKQLQSELNGIKSSLSAQQQAQHQRVLADAQVEIDAFAADAANVHFSEVGQDMIGYVRQGLSLKDAYDKAVWANPASRQKEIERIQTEAAANLKEKAKQEAQKAQTASSVNVRSSASRAAPTEPKGKFLDSGSMADDLKAIRSRHN